MSTALVDALISALEDKAKALQDHSGCGLEGDAYDSYAGAREGFSEWISALIEQFHEGEIDSDLL